MYCCNQPKWSRLNLQSKWILGPINSLYTLYMSSRLLMDLSLPLSLDLVTGSYDNWIVHKQETTNKNVASAIISLMLNTLEGLCRCSPLCGNIHECTSIWIFNHTWDKKLWHHKKHSSPTAHFLLWYSSVVSTWMFTLE